MDVQFGSLEELWPLSNKRRVLSRPVTSFQGRRSLQLDRPKSVPVASSKGKPDVACHLQMPVVQDHSRSLIASPKSNCPRLAQLEQDPERKKFTNTVFNVKKSVKPQWQTNAELFVPCVVGPGYVLSRSRSRLHVQLSEGDIDSPKESATENHSKPTELNSPERDSLIALLRQQIDDLMLALEEEKLNHKETKRQATEHLKVKIDDVSRHYRNEIEALEKKNLKKLASVREDHAAEMTECMRRSDEEIKKLHRENDLLQAAFDAYKLQLMDEMNAKLNQRLNEVKKNVTEEAENQLQDLRARLISEKHAEKTDIENAYQEKLNRLKRDHKLQIIELRNRYSESATDMEKLKQTETALQDSQKEFNQLQDVYQNACLQMDEYRIEIDQLKMKLMEWEEKFDTRIKDIDRGYREEIDENKKQLSELRILYIKKCSQLLDLKHAETLALNERVLSTKEMMKVVIETRARSKINLASGDNSDLERLDQKPKTRPSTAPITQCEKHQAILSAGLVADAEQLGRNGRRSAELYKDL